LAAKSHWGYPQEWLDLWTPSLTFDRDLLAREWVRVADDGDAAIAVIAVGGEPPDLELSHLWVDPPVMGRGLGRLLFDAAIAYSRRRGARRLKIVSDPNAEGFYERLGAQRIGAVASLPADRSLPLMECTL
jgi:GNAT superfamily N-acetyltransferase